jgi:hypothetical protein
MGKYKMIYLESNQVELCASYRLTSGGLNPANTI